MRHAAMLNSLEIVGLVSPRFSLWLISWLEIAVSRWWATCWLARTASTAAEANPMTRAVRSATSLAVGASCAGERGRWRAESRVRPG